MSFDAEIMDLAARLGQAAAGAGLHCVTAESCTGGLIAGAITAIPGSSQWFELGFVTYDNQAKIELLGVRADTLQRFGAVSRETAVEMAAGAVSRSHADLAVAVTGIAGPNGGSADKPVGTVWIAFCRRGKKAVTCCHHFAGDRSAVRARTVISALQGLISCAQGQELLYYK